MNALTQKVMFGSKNQNLQTPPKILKLVNDVAPIGFDPCPANPTFDGLKVSWRGHGLVYENPPYDEIAKWLLKGNSQFSKTRVGVMHDQLVVLIPARTDTKWFHEMVLGHADAICLWKGRITFHDPETGEPLKTYSKKDKTWKVTPAPFPSMLLYFGARPKRFEEVFSPHGWIVRP